MESPNCNQLTKLVQANELTADGSQPLLEAATRLWDSGGGSAAAAALRQRLVADDGGGGGGSGDPSMLGGGLPIRSADGRQGLWLDLRRNPLGELPALTWVALALAGVVETGEEEAPPCTEAAPGHSALEISSRHGWVPAIQRMLASSGRKARGARRRSLVRCDEGDEG